MKRVRKNSAADHGDVAPGNSHAVLPPDLQAAAVRLMTRAEAMGLISSDEITGFSVSALDAAMRSFAAVGIGRGFVRPTDAEEVLGNALDLMNAIVENSPVPGSEWSAMLGVFSPEVLTKFLGISDSSLRRYSTNERPTPAAVAVRLHWLAMRVADLAGAYNHYGIVRWFDRPRRALDGQSAAQRLTGDWSPDDEKVQQVAALAADLVAMAAT